MNPTQRELDSQAAQDFLAANPHAFAVTVGSVRRDSSGHERPAGGCSGDGCHGCGTCNDSGWIVHNDRPKTLEESDRELAEAGKNVERMIVLAAVAFVLLLAGAIAMRFPQLLAALGV